MVSKPDFIYPQWMSAKRSLVEKLMAVDGGVSRQHLEIIDAWMKNYIFEFGVEANLSKFELERADTADEFIDHMRRQAMFMLIESIHKKVCFVRYQVLPLHSETPGSPSPYWFVVCRDWELDQAPGGHNE